MSEPPELGSPTRLQAPRTRAIMGEHYRGGNGSPLLQWNGGGITGEGMQSHCSGGMMFSVEWVNGGVLIGMQWLGGVLGGMGKW